MLPVTKLVVDNFKSIRHAEIELGRVNVFIGENGAGKSNLLEAVAHGVLWPALMELLPLRGARAVDQRLWGSAFPDDRPAQDRELFVQVLGVSRQPIEEDAARRRLESMGLGSALVAQMLEWVRAGRGSEVLALMHDLSGGQRSAAAWVPTAIRDFAIYAPEHSALRIFQHEGQLLPLGVRGEGLFRHLKDLSRNPATAPLLAELGNHLALLGWFESFDIPKDLAPGEQSIVIRDRFLAEGALFDQRSANEGFLYLLFYFTLLVSPDTPQMFAIDNVDASLNPKLCTTLATKIVELAKQHDRQCLLTTHNPAFLDGLDLHDDEQRLFVVERSLDGDTQVRRVEPPRARAGEKPVPLSVAFVRGYLGGLPETF